MPVDALTPTWINAPDDVSGPTYDAETLRRDLGGLVAGGSAAGVARSGVLDPRALVPSLSGSNVQVGPGPCALGSGKGAYLSGLAAVSTIATLGSSEWPAADSTNPRRDRLVFEVLDPDNGGSTARKARIRVIPGQPSATALTGGGYPADPGSADGVSTFIPLADIDVPKSGNGSPSITDKRPYTAAAGAPVPVRNKAERDALPKWYGARCERLDRAGAVEFCDGNTWATTPTAPFIEFAADPNVAESGKAWGLGVLRVATGYAPDQSFVTSPATDQIQVRDAGLYLITPMVSFDTPISGVSWLSADGAYTATMGGGLQNFTTTMPIPLAAGAIVKPLLSHGSGVNKSFNGRVRVVKIG